jgi:hypothetical protein
MERRGRIGARAVGSARLNLPMVKKSGASTRSHCRGNRGRKLGDRGGRETWGGSFWTPVSIDRAKTLVYVPVGNPAPDFFGDIRKGINLYTNSLAVLDLATGKPTWVKQFVPHDVRDWDLSQASPLVRVATGDNSRDIVVVSGKDGSVRLVDRDTHETLSDVAISKQENTETPVTVEGVHICPGLLGGQEWSSSAYDQKHDSIITPWSIGVEPRTVMRQLQCIRQACIFTAVKSTRALSSKARECSLRSMLFPVSFVGKPSSPHPCWPM